MNDNDNQHLTEGTDKHEDPDWAPDTLGIFTHTTCTKCGTPIYTAPHQTGQCLDCARTTAGITWPSSQPLGDWHPTVGYPRPLPPGEKPPHHETGWAWACTRCRAQGQATNNQHAIAMGRIHDTYACPLQPGITPGETLLRIARRAALSRLNPHTTPWMHYHNGRAHMGPPSTP
jgi:hypothetical protein